MAVRTTRKGLIDLLLQRSTRERRLLGLAVICLLLGGAAALLPPLAERRVAAERALDEARATALWLEARRIEMAQLRDGARAQPDAEALPEPVGLAAVQRGLEAAQLSVFVADLSGGGDGAVTLRFDAVPFQQLIAWVDTLPQRSGYRAEQFRLSATDAPGQIAARLTLRPVQAP